MACHEKELLEYALAGQMVSVLSSSAVPKNWDNFMFSQLEKDELVTKNETDKAVAELRVLWTR